MEFRFRAKSGNKTFDEPSYTWMYIYARNYIHVFMHIYVYSLYTIRVYTDMQNHIYTWIHIFIYTRIRYTRDRCRSLVTTMGWVGVGWGWNDNVPWTCTHLDATSVSVSCYGDHGGVGWGLDDNVPGTCTHLWCYACVCVVLRRSWWGGVGWGWEDNALGPCTYLWCYACVSVMQLYRNDCSRGTIITAPKDAFVPQSLTWLD